MKQEDIMTKAYLELSKNLLLDTYSSNKNIVISPYSLYVLLVMFFNMSSGKTRQDLATILGAGENVDEFLTFAKEIHQGLTNVRCGAKMCSSNGIIVSNGFSKYVNNECVEEMTRLLGVELINCDRNIIDTVNGWVSKNTNGMINSIISELPAHSMAFILNALSFDGAWVNQYYGDAIEENAKFNNLDGTISNVSMLRQIENNYLEDDYFTGIRKGYSGSKYSFIALLPKEDYRDPICEESIRQMNFAEYMKDREGWYVVDSKIPEYKCETSLELNDYCNKEGISGLFSPDSDFSYFSNRTDFSIDSVIQKAVIEVNRDGTKAGAVSGGVLNGDGFSSRNVIKKQVYLNRPFVYAIVENNSCLPIFMGVVTRL